MENKVVVDLQEVGEEGKGRENCCDCFGSLGFNVVFVDAVKRNRSSGVLYQ